MATVGEPIPADPTTALLSAGLGLTGAALGSPAGPSSALGGQLGGAAFDSSGWNVSFGANSGISSARSQTPALSGYLPYVIVIAVGLVAWRISKHR